MEICVKMYDGNIYATQLKSHLSSYFPSLSNKLIQKPCGSKDLYQGFMCIYT